MKKILFVVAAVASIVFTACNKEEFSVSENAPVGTIEFTASFDAETKTTLNNGKTEWVEGDEISINGVKFTANESGASVKFTNAETPQGEFKAPFNAVYPYNATLPKEKIVSNGTFADESVVSVAFIEGKGDNDLTFKHVSSVIEFQVANDVNSAIVFESSEDLAGVLGVNKDATYSVSSNPSKTITVKHTSGTFKAGETYYVSVLPTSGDAKVDFSAKVEGVTVKSGKVALKRNTVMDAKTIEVKYIYMKPSLVWNIANPRYAAYFFADGNKEVWVDMNDNDSDGIYRAVVPEGFSTVVYCRMNPDKEANNWDNKWSQTNDLNVNVGNVYAIKPLTWDNGSGTWYSLDYAKKSHKEKTIYLKPNSNWKEAGARFAVFLCNGNKGDKWLSMTKLDDNYYGVEQPSDFTVANYKNIIFCRMNPSNSTNSWDNKWNQTGDLETSQIITSNNYCCKINDGQWDAGTNVTWSKVLD